MLLLLLLLCIPRGGATRALGQERGTTPASVTHSSAAKKCLSDATLVSVSVKSCFTCAWTSFVAASSTSFEFHVSSRVSQLSRNCVSMEEFLARHHRKKCAAICCRNRTFSP